ncbi:MAG: VanZ family protein [Candidatus Omnitrophica bacterium]|nr:VanZ family protein [Candidatus Omnitrophota bacterium]
MTPGVRRTDAGWTLRLGARACPGSSTGGRWWLSVGAYAALILFGAVIPIEPSISVDHLDLVVHLVEYLLFAWLLVQALRHEALRAPDVLTLAWISATSYGVLIELLQGLLPWRSADLADAVVNALGAALGVWVGQRIPRRPARD